MELEIWTDYPKGCATTFKKLHAGETFIYEDEYYIKTDKIKEAFNLECYTTHIFEGNEQVQEIKLILLSYKEYNHEE